MKLIFISVLFLLFFHDIKAQKLIFNEDFESADTLSPIYLTINNDGHNSVLEYFKGSEEAWVVGEIPHEPNNNFVITSSKYEVEKQADDWLISPKIELTQNNYILWRAGNSSNKEDNWEKYQFLVSNNGADIECDFEMLYESIPPCNFEYPKIDLSIYAGEEIHFAFRGVGRDGWMLFLDDIEIVELHQNDISLDDVNLPAFLTPGDYTAQIEISNFGIDKLNQFNISWRINDEQQIYSHVISGLEVETFGRLRIDLPEKINFAEKGLYNISFWVSDPNGNADEYNDNDTISLNITVTESGSGLKHQTAESAMIVFPNPAEDELSFKLPAFFEKTCSVKIINHLGETLYIKKHDAGYKQDNIKLDITNLPSGLYYLCVSCKRFIVRESFIIIR